MTQITHNELRTRFLAFFSARQHLILPSGPLVPKDDKSTLFTTAGVQPLIPYLKMEKQAPASRMADAQKCLRTNDIADVGDNSHLTFFEMLGSWSVGDYDKKEAITFAHDFLTTAEGLNLPKERLWVTVFAGSEELPKDTEAAQIWQSIGMPKERIAYLPEADNWWSVGPVGPCGPDTEVFYDLLWPAPVPEGQNPGNDPSRRFVEIWNTVFMSYDRQADGLRDLPSQNIDEGAGLERLLSVLNGKNIYDTSCFKECVEMLRSRSSVSDPDLIVPIRIIADHLRTSLFVLSEEPRIYPSATEHGYVLRRLIRSAIAQGTRIGLPSDTYEDGLRIYSEIYAEAYPEVKDHLDDKIRIFRTEQAKFEKVILRAPKVWENFTKSARGQIIDAQLAFRMVTEQGIPLEILNDLAKNEGREIDQRGLADLIEQHRAVSREPKAI